MSRTLHLFGTDWCAMMVPIQVIRWYRMQCYDGTDSCAIVVPIRRYCHFNSFPWEVQTADCWRGFIKHWSASPAILPDKRQYQTRKIHIYIHRCRHEGKVHIRKWWERKLYYDKISIHLSWLNFLRTIVSPSHLCKKKNLSLPKWKVSRWRIEPDKTCNS